jgi:hypothetical protein
VVLPAPAGRPPVAFKLGGGLRIVFRLLDAVRHCDRCDLCISQYHGELMPEKQTVQRARQDAREGKAPSTQAGEFVREEIEHIREGKHGARSTKQAIAIGLSKARRAGVKLPAPKAGQASARTRKQAKRDIQRGHSASSAAHSSKRSRAASRTLKNEGRSAASHSALAKHAKSVARKRSHAAKSQQAKRAARTRRANQASRGSK